MTVPFPDAWDSYQFAEEACGHSPKSIQTRRTSVLPPGEDVPGAGSEDITHQDLEKYISGMRKTLKPMTVFGSYNDLRSFFAWLAEDTGGNSLHHGVNPVQFSRLPSIRAASGWAVIEAASTRAVASNNTTGLSVGGDDGTKVVHSGMNQQDGPAT